MLIEFSSENLSNNKGKFPDIALKMNPGKRATAGFLFLLMLSQSMNALQKTDTESESTMIKQNKFQNLSGIYWKQNVAERQKREAEIAIQKKTQYAASEISLFVFYLWFSRFGGERTISSENRARLYKTINIYVCMYGERELYIQRSRNGVRFFFGTKGVWENKLQRRKHLQEVPCLYSGKVREWSGKFLTGVMVVVIITVGNSTVFWVLPFMVNNSQLLALLWIV